MIVSVYVDDLIYTGSDYSMMEEFKMTMKSELDMTDVGKMSFFLGIEVTQLSDRIHVSQSKYALEILRRFKMEDCNGVCNPIVLRNKSWIWMKEENI